MLALLLWPCSCGAEPVVYWATAYSTIAASASVRYPDNMECKVTITVPGGLAGVGLQFTEFYTQTGVDTLELFDGPTISSTQLLTLTGTLTVSRVLATGCKWLTLQSHISTSAYCCQRRAPWLLVVQV